MRRRLALVCVPALLSAWSAPASAQSPALERPSDVPTIGAWFGLAQHSPGRPVGKSTGNDLAVIAIQLTRTLHQSAHWSLDYLADVVPAAWLSVQSRADSMTELPPLADRPFVYGFGATPLGLELRLAPHARVQPFLSAAGGALWFRAPVPAAQAGRFNFTAAVGAGVLYRPTRALGVIAGYKLQHISNGGTRPVNPGIDNNMFYLGLVRPIRSWPAGSQER